MNLILRRKFRFFFFDFCLSCFNVCLGLINRRLSFRIFGFSCLQLIFVRIQVLLFLVKLCLCLCYLFTYQFAVHIFLSCIHSILSCLGFSLCLSCLSLSILSYSRLCVFCFFSCIKSCLSLIGCVFCWSNFLLSFCHSCLGFRNFLCTCISIIFLSCFNLSLSCCNLFFGLVNRRFRLIDLLRLLFKSFWACR